MNPIFLIDFYKVGHVVQYPKNITQVWSNWTPRSSRVEGVNSVVHFGLQYFVKKYLQTEFQENFFDRPLSAVLGAYDEVITMTLGVKNPKCDHIEALHNLGYLPIKIYSLPEGTNVPLNVPAMVITNTHPDFYWLPNYLETILSCILWKPSTSATTAQQYRKVFIEAAKQAGETDFSFVDWQGHDFSMRGMSGVEDAVLSGMGHLLSFSGTDSLPAILAAQQYYGAKLNCGGSVPATEHSVMCAGNKDGELETFRRLIEDVYPSGIVSIVSDTWDLWKVLTEYIPQLRDKILARDGKIVIRPDSGDPVKIICGDEELLHKAGGQNGYAYYGAAILLANVLGATTNGKGYAHINKGGLIYGDSITVDRAKRILTGLMNKGLHPYNMVFGIGSYTYEYVTRDTFGFAMKATAVREGSGPVIPIFKTPITDDGGKFSHKGIPSVWWKLIDREAPPHGALVCKQESTEQDLDDCAFEKVFENGKLLVEYSFDKIRQRVRE